MIQMRDTERLLRERIRELEEQLEAARDDAEAYHQLYGDQTVAREELQEQLQAALDSTMHQENYDAACLRADEAEAERDRLKEQLEAAEKALRWAGYGPMPGGGWAKVYREASNPASIREEVRSIDGPLSPDELEETVTRALDSFGGSSPASAPGVDSAPDKRGDVAGNVCRKCGVYGCEHVFPGAPNVIQDSDNRLTRQSARDIDPSAEAHS